MTRERIIGLENDMPWRIPEDQRLFREITLGHPVVMGRKTFESLPAPLKKRRNIVISRSWSELPDNEDTELVSSLNEAIDLVSETTNEIFIIGGAQIYTAALPLADRLYISRVHKEYAGDTLFPMFSEELWPITETREFSEFTLEIRERSPR